MPDRSYVEILQNNDYPRLQRAQEETPRLNLAFRIEHQELLTLPYAIREHKKQEDAVALVQQRVAEALDKHLAKMLDTRFAAHGSFPAEPGTRVSWHYIATEDPKAISHLAALLQEAGVPLHLGEGLSATLEKNPKLPKSLKDLTGRMDEIVETVGREALDEVIDGLRRDNLAKGDAFIQAANRRTR